MIQVTFVFAVLVWEEEAEADVKLSDCVSLFFGLQDDTVFYKI